MKEITKDIAKRVVKTFLETFLGFITVGGLLQDIDWVVGINVAAVAALYTLIINIIANIKTDKE